MAPKQMHLVEVNAAAQSVSGAAALAVRQSCVLLIGHEQDPSGSVVRLLESAGYQCLFSSGADSAWDCIRKAAPDLIISDINLSGHSGVALCEQLKHRAGLEQVPVMFFSTTQIPDIIRRSHAAGGTYYLRKPCDPEVLLELIEQALQWSQRTVPAASHRN